MKFAVKRLTPKHYDDIICVWQKAKLHHTPTGRDNRRNLTRQMKLDPDLFFGAFAGKTLVGVVFGSYDGRRGTINRLSVIPEFRRKGIASKLVTRCEKALKARGAMVISTLIDLPNSGSVGLFENSGYIPHKNILYLSKRDGPRC